MIREALDENAFEDVPLWLIRQNTLRRFTGLSGRLPRVRRSSATESVSDGSANADEAIREISLDVNEGADIIM